MPLDYETQLFCYLYSQDIWLRNTCNCSAAGACHDKNDGCVCAMGGCQVLKERLSGPQ